MFLRVDIPPLPEYKVRELGLEDVKACWWISRPAYLLVLGRLPNEGFPLTPVYECKGRYSLYKGTVSLVWEVKEKIKSGEIKIEPSPPAEETFITEKQKRLIEELARELKVKVSIPKTRKRASLLIQKLISLKQKKRKIKQKQKAF